MSVTGRLSSIDSGCAGFGWCSRFGAIIVLLVIAVSGCSTPASQSVPVADAVIAIDPTASQTATTDTEPSRAEMICQEALLRGVDFRATGNEPGWMVEISDDDSVLLVLNYGADRYRFESPKPQSLDATIRYPLQQGSHHLTLTLEARRCQDSMSGVVYPTRVTLEFDGRTLSGCGKALPGIDSKQ